MYKVLIFTIAMIVYTTTAQAYKHPQYVYNTFNATDFYAQQDRWSGGASL